MTAPSDSGAPLAGASPERRQRFLDEIGVGPQWLLRKRAAGPAAASSQAGPATHVDADVAPVAMPADPAAAAMPQALPAASAAAHRQPAARPPIPADMPMPASAGADDIELSSLDWGALQTHATSCTACALCKNRSQVVFGDGDERAQWLFVTTAPSRADDEAGVPLAGRRGQLMDNMLRAAGLNRIAGTYLTPAVKCLALDENGRERAPSAAEAAACRPILERQLALLAPQVVVAMGRANPLRPPELARGQAGRLGAAALVVTADPHALLDHPEAKAQAWADLCLAKSLAG